MVLKDYFEPNTVENIVIFVADSLRYDYLPKSIKKMGVLAKTVAASTGTAASLPSITSGTYPSTHQIWSIYDQSFRNKPELFDCDNFGYNAKTSWSHLKSKNKPTLKVHNILQEKNLSELSEPFVYFVHDYGAHQPYDRSYSSDEFFFNDYSNNIKGLKKLYRQRVADSSQRFLDICEKLKDRGIFNKTLVIFTSDHGELLGEHGGQFSHHQPLVPELILVPTVFAGGGIKTGKKIQNVISSIDIAPTVMAAQNKSIPEKIEGINLWDDSIKGKRNARSEVRETLECSHITFPTYFATSLTNRNGTLVYNSFKSYNNYGWGAIFKLFKQSPSVATRSNTNLRKIIKILSVYKPGYIKYGDPQIKKIESKFNHRFFK